MPKNAVRTPSRVHAVLGAVELEDSLAENQTHSQVDNILCIIQPLVNMNMFSNTLTQNPHGFYHLFELFV